MKRVPGLTSIEYSLYLMCKRDNELLEYFFSYYLQKLTLLNHFYPHIEGELKGYSDHGEKHVKNILKLYTKMLINVIPCEEEDTFEIPTDIVFNYYELYLLLCATIWHDIGNLKARNQHNRHLSEISDRINHYFVDKDMKDLTMEIARAHTGEDAVTKEIQVEITPYKNELIVSRFIGAILRFADELDEGQNRVDLSYYERMKDTIPSHQRVFWESCGCIKRIEPNPDKFDVDIEIKIKKEDMFNLFDKKLKEGTPYEKEIKVALIDELIFRLNKINKERMYYMTFIQKFVEYKTISTAIYIIDNGNSTRKTFVLNDSNGYTEFWREFPELNPGNHLKGYCLQGV